MQQNNAFPRAAQQIYIAETPEPGVTHGQPFAPGTGGSQNFRIPAIVMLENGTLFAACDARWDHDGDGAGIDTIVSTSKDGGKSWHYRFANYLGDNGNQFNDLSTSFMDGALGTDGDTLYLVVDLFPAGFALNTSRYRPVAGRNGLDEHGNLRLRQLQNDSAVIGEPEYGEAAAAGNYDYYLSFADYKWNGTEYIHGRYVEVDTGISKTACNQLSAIRYSLPVNRKDVILLSTADGDGRSRSNGTIYLLTLEDDNAVSFANSRHITIGYYAYSCLTEMADGDLALLYECGDASIAYQPILMSEFLSKR